VSSYYRFVDGRISDVVITRETIDFEVESRLVTVERTAATAALRNGDRIRMLLQAPMDDTFFHLLAFQKVDGGRIHYTGPRVSAPISVIGATLLATGLYINMAFLLISATSLFALQVIFSLQQVETLREFERY
jgi:hypothetical protein